MASLRAGARAIAGDERATSDLRVLPVALAVPVIVASALLQHLVGRRVARSTTRELRLQIGAAVGGRDGARG